MLGGTVVPNDHGAGSPKVTGNIDAEATLITTVASLAWGGGGGNYCTVVQQKYAVHRTKRVTTCSVGFTSKLKNKGINTRTGELMS